MIVANQFKTPTSLGIAHTFDYIVFPAGSGEFVAEEAQVFLHGCAVNLLASHPLVLAV